MRPPNTYRTMDVLRSLAGGGEKRSGGDNLGPYIFLSFGDCPHFLPQNKSSVERGRIGGKVERKKGSLSGLSSPDFLGDGSPVHQFHFSSFSRHFSSYISEMSEN